MDFRRPQRTAVIASAIVSVICLGLLSRSWTPQTTPLDVQVSRESARPREAYVSFISSTKKKGYVDSLRLLLWSLKYDPLTRDPYNRDFIVLTTNYTSPDVVAQLQAEGAITRDTPLILGMPNLYSSGFGEDHNYRDVYTKLAVWNMTDYDRVFFLDADILIIKQIHLLWDHPNADPPSGLAALSDAKWGQNHPIPLPDHPYFNCGTMILRPVEGRLEELLAVQDYDLALPEQVSVPH
jgi:alpha-N-acetylglucosamine transferase